ncbi:MAG: hypothetical protein H2046_07735 [Rhizobiales bacterium]|jgi:hypothetical protein|nr:hypothetical protein [Hyphomicrobiales bacterium]|tara:strand:+ start:394 stop:588 length:195 start_codon:yes stop_codon:yes gene_type:complete
MVVDVVGEAPASTVWANSDLHQWVPAGRPSVVDEDIDDKDVAEAGTFAWGHCSKVTSQSCSREE